MILTVHKLSATTGKVDCTDVVKKYLKSINHAGSLIGETEVYTIRQKGRPRTIAAFGTLAEAEKFIEDWREGK
jgi:hypothetical protein